MTTNRVSVSTIASHTMRRRVRLGAEHTHTSGAHPHDFARKSHRSPRKHTHNLLGNGGRLGVQHHGHLADATNALSLVSTLVLSTSITTLLNPELMLTMDVYTQTQILCLCGASTTATCTLCFSLLEYFYLQTVAGVDQSVESTLHLSSDQIRIQRVRVAAVTDSIFEKFSVSRKLSRHCIWASLILLLFSIGCKLLGERRRLVAELGDEAASVSLGVAVAACVLLALGILFVIVHVPLFRVRYWRAIHQWRERRDGVSLAASSPNASDCSQTSHDDAGVPPHSPVAALPRAMGGNPLETAASVVVARGSPSLTGQHATYSRTNLLPTARVFL